MRRDGAFGIPRSLAVVGLNLLVAAFALLCLYPFFLAIVTTLKSLAALFGLALWPATPSLNNCLALIAQALAQPSTGHLVNLLAVSFMVVVVSLFLGVTADYAFGRAPFRGRCSTLAVLAMTMLPQVAALSLVFELMSKMEHYNHWWGLTLPYMIFTLPFAVWVVVAFAGQPRRSSGVAYAGAAVSLRGIVRRVVWPALYPALLATGLLAFIAAWNEFMFALTFVLDTTQRSPPMSFSLTDVAGHADAPWATIMAGVALAAFPAIALVLAFQRKTPVDVTCRTARG
jgi:trehalose/maltose transport system permease protein